MRILKKDTPFFWDDQAQRAFNNIKHDMIHSPIIHFPDYSNYFLLYVSTCTSTIGMILDQEDQNSLEHVIYYASKNLLDSETRYSHVEKLALATIMVVQKFRR